MAATMSSVTSLGVLAPGMRTVPMTKSAASTCSRTASAVLASPWMRLSKSQMMRWSLRRSTSRIVTSAPMPSAIRAAF